MTLIELIVGMTIIALLAALTVGFLSNVQYQARAGIGAGMLQGWLNTARQRAIRDQKPYGLRFLPNPGNPAFVTDCQFLEQPDDWIGDPCKTLSATKVQFVGSANPISGGFTSSALFPVQPGDYFELMGIGQVRRIKSVQGFPSNTLDLDQPLDFTLVNQTSNYRIIRTPRPVADEVLQLPEDIGVDLNTNTTYQTSYGNVLPPVNADGSYDVIFKPNGALLVNASNQGFYAFWVRDMTIATVLNREPTLVAVFVGTGQVAAHPPSPSGNPYQFITDGRSSGK